MECLHLIISLDIRLMPKLVKMCGLVFLFILLISFPLVLGIKILFSPVTIVIEGPLWKGHSLRSLSGNDWFWKFLTQWHLTTFHNYWRLLQWRLSQYLPSKMLRNNLGNSSDFKSEGVSVLSQTEHNIVATYLIMAGMYNYFYSIKQ